MLTQEAHDVVNNVPILGDGGCREEPGERIGRDQSICRAASLTAATVC